LWDSFSSRSEPECHVHACIGPRATHADLDAAQSAVEVAFWEELGALKLNTLRLSEEPVAVQGAALCSSACFLLLCRCSSQPSESCAAGPSPSPRALQPVASRRRLCCWPCRLLLGVLPRGAGGALPAGQPVARRPSPRPPGAPQACAARQARAGSFSAARTWSGSRVGTWPSSARPAASGGPRRTAARALGAALRQAVVGRVARRARWRCPASCTWPTHWSASRAGTMARRWPAPPRGSGPTSRRARPRRARSCSAASCCSRTPTSRRTASATGAVPARARARLLLAHALQLPAPTMRTRGRKALAGRG